MLRRLNRKTKGQSTAEYAILIGLVIAAAVAMQIYVKRGLQARVHDASLYLVNKTNVLESDIANPEKQYEPYYLESTFEVNRFTGTNVDLEEGKYTSFENSVTNRAKAGSQEYKWNKESDEYN